MFGSFWTTQARACADDIALLVYTFRHGGVETEVKLRRAESDSNSQTWEGIQDEVMGRGITYRTLNLSNLTPTGASTFINRKNGLLSRSSKVASS